MSVQHRAVEWPHTQASKWVAAELGQLRAIPARTADERRRADICSSHIQHVGRVLGERAASRLARGEDPALVRLKLEAGLATAARNMPHDVRLVSQWSSVKRTITAAARGLARSRHDAEDLEGAVVEKTLRAFREGLAPDGDPDLWLRVVARNAWRDLWRAVAKHEAVLVAARGEGRRVHACNGDRTADAVLARSAARAFAQCLVPHGSDSPAVVRQRLVMRMMLAGAETAEVAVWLHVSEARVRQDVNRFRRRVEQEDSLAAGLFPPRNSKKARKRLTHAAPEPDAVTALSG
jgi:DNA-directed RNA polymerase specialized sigma24 family protein